MRAYVRGSAKGLFLTGRRRYFLSRESVGHTARRHRVGTRADGRHSHSAAGYATPLYGKWHLDGENSRLPNDGASTRSSAFPRTTDEAMRPSAVVARHTIARHPFDADLQVRASRVRGDPVAGLRAPASQRPALGYRRDSARGSPSACPPPRRHRSRLARWGRTSEHSPAQP